jgi:hypothetical protein
MKPDLPVRTVNVRGPNGHEHSSKEVVFYPSLLSQAHSEELKRIRTRLVQVPDDANHQTAIVKALVETSRGTFEALGDANPENVEAFLIPHLIRVAETRAKARALRDAVNVGVVSFEELDGTDLLPERSDPGLGAAQPSRFLSGNGAPRRARSAGTFGATGPTQSSSEFMTEGQRRFLFRLMAGEGVTGEAAHRALKNLFEVENLADVKKMDASATIDQMLAQSGQQGSRRAHA